MVPSARRGAILAQEQKAVDHAYACLARTADERTQLSTLAVAASNGDASALQRSREQELAELELGETALTFLHVDVVDSGPLETFYVGRRLVRDEVGEPVVIKWTAPEAVRWRQATPDAPGSVRLLRQLTCDGQRVLRCFDQIAAAAPTTLEADVSPDDVASAKEVDGAEWADPLLAELDRARDGAMHDIVETIQREQLALVVEQPAGLLVVQGGPGTGKTAVGLHRITWLLDNAHGAAGDFLVVGPSRQFLGYVGTLLPQLGSRGVTLLDLPALWEAQDSPVDPLNVRRIKSDLRMVRVLSRVIEGQANRSIEQLRTRLGGDIFTFALHRREIVVPLSEIAEVASKALGTDAPYLIRRTGCIQRVVDHLTSAYVAAQTGPARTDYFSQVAELREVDRLLQFICPETSEVGVFGQLWKSRAALAEVADGILSEEEQNQLFESRPAVGTSGAGGRTLDDRVLLDEIGHLLRGRNGRTYAHVVIDEAQDLTPMQARSLARRCPAGSMTVLGDLAQATGPHRYEGWNTLAGCLASQDGWRLAELVTGFRVPSEVMDFARPLGSACAPGVLTPASVRTTGIEVQLRRTPEPVEDAVAQVRKLQHEASGNGRSVAVIVPDGSSWERNVQIQMQASVLPLGVEGSSQVLEDRLAVLAASDCKGLEFDHVIVVEPAAIAAGDDAGFNRLYVALTRCTQSLTIYHRAPLPAVLSGEGSAIPLPSAVFGSLEAGDGSGTAERHCSRYHADGSRCANWTTNPDSWCRSSECGGYRTSQPVTGSRRSTWFRPLTGGDPSERLSLSQQQLKRIRVSAAAQQEFQRIHGGNPREAAVELHAMVTALLVDGTHDRAPNGYWYLEHLGYRLVLSPDADAVTNYRSGHLERSYAQIRAGVPSRADKDARANRRSGLTPARGERGEWLERADASGYAPADLIHVTPSACAAFERAQPGVRDLSDEDFILALREAYATDLDVGTAVLHDALHLLVGTELAWSISGDGQALTGVRRRAGADIPTPRHEESAATSKDEEPVSTAPITVLPTDLREIVAERVRIARQDRAHEALRFRLLAELYEGATDAGTDELADAWSTVSGEHVLYEVVVPGSDLYASIREAALQVMEIDYLRDSEGADHLVLVLPGAPLQQWIDDASRQAFSIKLLWREDGTWAGSGRGLVPSS